MSRTLTTFNQQRAGHYRKDQAAEDFLGSLNDVLAEREAADYPAGPPTLPSVFVFGIPRSATTLTSQVVAHGLDLSYIDNVAARFWRAPLHGMRLSDIILGGDRGSAFRSDYARTDELGDIHEFGYFWREWLRKESLEEIARSPEVEDDINWDGLRRVLAGLEQYSGKGLAAKNINGSYHVERMNRELGPLVWVYIERDPLDAAISIHDAREKYYGDRSLWWSYAPLEYPQLVNEPWDRQITGQVHFLRRYYEQLGADHPNVVRVSYDELCSAPHAVLQRISDTSAEVHGMGIPLTTDKVPESFPQRTYAGERSELREQLAARLAEWESEAP